MTDTTHASSSSPTPNGHEGGDGSPHDALIIGLDVGSTAVKYVVVAPHSQEILYADYRLHETRQPEKVLEVLKEIEERFPLPPERFSIFVTGSGGQTLAPYIGARFVQEVNAVSMAAEALQPDVGSVIELGGQDAKIIIWREDPKTGRKRKLANMNDKCAGGTGAVIDRIAAKLHLSKEQLQEVRRANAKVHPIAGKCGVFAETDMNSLQKQGVPADDLMVSLFEAIVQQNLSVLTRGNVLRPKVLLLGGPNTFLPCLQEAWQRHIPRLWEERGLELPDGSTPEELIVVPEHSLYYAALGTTIYGQQEEGLAGIYAGTAALEEYIDLGRRKAKQDTGQQGPLAPGESIEELRRLYGTKPFTAPAFSPGQVVEGYIGLDGGSTSTKAVLTDADGNLLVKAYQLCKGNPLQDAKEVLGELRRQVEEQGATIRVLGMATTGYAKDLLKEALGADIAIPETVAHAQSALRYYPDVDVIADVGGQDIKVIIMKAGAVKDFKLNTQCSAGNGYFLQSTTARFGYELSEWADIALSAERAPAFHYGCAVFLEQDISHFQQLGWQPSEIMAGWRPRSTTAAPSSWSRTSRTSSNSAGSRRRSWPAGADAAQERLAVRRPGDEPGPLRQDVPPPGRHPLQPGGGQGAIRFHQGARAGREYPRPPARRRERRPGRGQRGDPRLRGGEHVHRVRPGGGAHLHGHARRIDALLLLQEQVSADVRRHQDIARAHVALHLGHLRAGDVGQHRRGARLQRPRERGEEGEPELRRDLGAGGVPQLFAADRRCRRREGEALPIWAQRQPDGGATARQTGNGADRDATAAHHVLLRPVLHRLPGEPGRSPP